MPTITEENIIPGQGELYLAAIGAALPEIDDLTPPTITVTPGVAWTYYGATLDVHALDYSLEKEEIYINETNLPLDSVITREGAIFGVKFMERSIAHFGGVIGASTVSTVAAGAGQTAQSILKLGDGSATFKQLLYLHQSPQSGSRLVHIFKTKALNPFKLTWKKGAPEAYDAMFMGYADMDRAVGDRLLRIYDITAVATS